MNRCHNSYSCRRNSEMVTTTITVVAVTSEKVTTAITVAVTSEIVITTITVVAVTSEMWSPQQL